MSRPLLRKSTPVGVAGEAGASYTVFEKNWTCKECKGENYATRPRCVRCRAPKPLGGGGVDWASTGGSEADGVKNTNWRETVDPNSGHLYYYNLKTGETTWDRPIEMGAAPHSTGWFGRGAAGGTSAVYEERDQKYRQRKARKQVDSMPNKNSSYLEGANEYNIWYGRYVGEHWTTNRGKEPAETRCHPDKDAGLTKADALDRKDRYYCLHFARGMCAKGYDCSYFHRIPLRSDDASLDGLHDIFGRERHRDHRDDMAGTGSFMSNCRTLYVGGLKHCKVDTDAYKKNIEKQFGEFGEVENVNLIPRLSIAFVRYRFRVSAEFAMESMGNQDLGKGEVLNVRWAYDDPNPVAKEAEQRANEDAMIVALQNGYISLRRRAEEWSKHDCILQYKARGISTEAAPFAYPEDYQLPQPKKIKTEDGDDPANNSSYTDAYRENTAVAPYPDTDGQYATAGSNVQHTQHNQAHEQELTTSPAGTAQSSYPQFQTPQPNYNYAAYHDPTGFSQHYYHCAGHDAQGVEATQWGQASVAYEVSQSYNNPQPGQALSAAGAKIAESNNITQSAVVSHQGSGGGQPTIATNASASDQATGSAAPSVSDQGEGSGSGQGSFSNGVEKEGIENSTVAGAFTADAKISGVQSDALETASVGGVRSRKRWRSSSKAGSGDG